MLKNKALRGYDKVHGEEEEKHAQVPKFLKSVDCTIRNALLT
jgi:hypothetical protein